MGGLSGGGGGGGRVTEHYLTLETALCHGPIDAVRSIWFADKQAWSGDLRYDGDSKSKFQLLYGKGLFGGESSEGGIAGMVEVGFGSRDQELLVVNPDGTTTPSRYPAAANTASRQGLTDSEANDAIKYMNNSGAQPWAPEKGTHYRGIAVLNFIRFYFGMSPYLKDISVEVERYWRGWFPEKAQVGLDANPIHIIYEAVTNASWGLGYDINTINDESFRCAATCLYNDGFGLSLVWSEQQEIESFVNAIIELIEASFYLDVSTGLWTIRLIREGDPVMARMIPGRVKLMNYKRKSLGETTNELVVRWVLPETEDFVALTIHDQANIEAQGQVISSTRDYNGVRNEALAARIGQRDLQAASALLAEAQVEGNRAMWDLYPGDTVELSWPPYGIESMRFRVKSTRHSEGVKNGILIDLVEDVFGQVSAVFSGGSAPIIIPGNDRATLFSPVTAFEMPYWFARQLPTFNQSDVETTFLSVFAVTDNNDARSAILHTAQTRPSGPVYVEVDSGNPSVSGIISESLGRAFTSEIVIPASTLVGSGGFPQDAFLIIGEGTNAEIARIMGEYSPTEQVVQIQRGLMDTHIRVWPAGTRIYLIEALDTLVDATARSMMESVAYKVAMQTSSDQYLVEDIPPTVTLLQGRQGRPYPPQNVRINDDYWPSVVAVEGGQLPISWSTRNRLLQDSDIQVQWNEGNVVPEAGTTYVYRLIQGGVTVAEDTVVGDTVSVPTAGLAEGQTTLELVSRRGGLNSYQTFTHSFTLRLDAVDYGYGASYGGFYGGKLGS